ncbi:hypothetical protein [Cohnella sp. JJ-181]|uniref:hypothetical protein n=1 Tax=Cohnella rhizoplanae TaxID=2974897 RepID=UPI0022FF9BB8|nr:hypothetical protein [Cohnella sp. JJ-181]CAI6082201.1 hypothetical protein COHCIP112018_03563 [Cohnella sp. JJ-181]
MRAVNRSVFVLLALAVWLASTGCDAKNRLKDALNACGEYEWGDFLIIGGVDYLYNQDGTQAVADEQRGKKIGEVTYTLDAHPCSEHKTADGVASYLPAGTPIYALIGYKTSYRVVADGRVYEAVRNPHAGTLGELYDLDGNFSKVSLESGIDGSPIGDFAPEASAVFGRELPRLKIVGSDTIHKNNKPEYGIFLRVHLKDGTSFRMVFYENANAFTGAGAYGTEALKAVIVGERARIKKAAGL